MWRNRYDKHPSEKDRIKTWYPIKTVWKVYMQKGNNAKWKWLCYTGKIIAFFFALYFYKIYNILYSQLKIILLRKEYQIESSSFITEQITTFIGQY